MINVKKGHQAITFASLYRYTSARKVLDVLVWYTLSSSIILIFIESSQC